MNSSLLSFSLHGLQYGNRKIHLVCVLWITGILHFQSLLDRGFPPGSH